MSPPRPITPSTTTSDVIPAPLTAGRKLDPVWAHVDIDPQGGVWCKKCSKLIQTTGRTHVERVKHHLEKRCASRANTPLITDMFRLKVKASILKEFHEKLALWVYSSGLAFFKIEHDSLFEALQVLAPGIKAPSRGQLSNALLDSTYDKSLKTMTAALERKVVTISSDGWTDVCGRAVINYMAVSGELCYFLGSVYTGDQAHDAEFLAGDMQRVIEKYGFLDVGAVTTDNTSTNKAMWAVLKAKYPRTFFHGCVCHALHLLVKDIVKKLPWLTRLQDGCRKLVTFFKHNHKLWSKLTTRLVNENLRLLAKPESILLSIVSARDFLAAKTKAKKKARRSVFDLATSKDFVQQLQKAVSILKPIGACSKQLEKDDTPISLVYKLFNDLPAEMQKTGLIASELKAVMVLVTARFKFVYGEAHGISYMLDPLYAGVDMDIETRSAVEDSLEAWFGEQHSDKTVLELSKYQTFLVEFRAKSKRQWKLLCDNKLPVYELWCGLVQFPLLRGVAMQVFRCAASSSSSERNFSTHGYIHSKLRNRLSPDRVEKLVHVFFNAKNVNDEELATYTHLEDLLRSIEDEDPSQDEAENRDDDFFYY